VLIKRVDIQNFRKLKHVRIEISEKTTLFVGANNSGKTSAMDALILFLKVKNHSKIKCDDFTISNWCNIQKIGTDWEKSSKQNAPNLSREIWAPYLPTIDIWLFVNNEEIHYVRNLIPSLDWEGGLLGVRLVFEPDIEKLFTEYHYSRISVEKILENKTREDDSNIKKIYLWPQSLKDFLDRKLSKFFHVNSYLLDPEKVDDINPQSLPINAAPLGEDPFNGLIKIDIENAQRGFSDPNNEEISGHEERRLSAQLRKYYNAHLDPEKSPSVEDLDALIKIGESREAYDDAVKRKFEQAIRELETLNYPGFSDPSIILTTKDQKQEGLNHNPQVKFNILKESENFSYESLSLPENYNGLGYQNLISIIFRLIQFRDEWMRVGISSDAFYKKDESIELLHLVLIEEPEAHLHAQVQQVFIKHAYKILRKPEIIKDSNIYSTQLIISTHSSHIAYETEFSSLRYFRRERANEGSIIPYATVINLSDSFGDEEETAKFVKRYIKTTHCDLFFADAVIIVEGSAERMLLPFFIKNHFSDLDRSYISLLEIDGSHAHKLKSLLEKLELLTLIITDLDSMNKNYSGGEEEKLHKVLPEREIGCITNNMTLKTWIPMRKSLDYLLNPDIIKISKNGLIRVAYQTPIMVSFFTDNPEEAIPYTFEDALVLDNISFFINIKKSVGLLKKMADSLSKPSLISARNSMFENLKTGEKAKMALDLLFYTEPEKLNPPGYISQGLNWLIEELRIRSLEHIESLSIAPCEL
jgi:predicted ATP-dependent endonuclease of OLD family